MKRFTLLIISIFFGIISLAQDFNSPIEIQQRLGKVYLQNGRLLPAKELHSILSSNEKAAVEVEQAKKNLAPLYLFSIAGGFLIGWPIGTAIGGGDPQWGLAAIGAGLVLLAIPFQVGYNKHIATAVRIYDSQLDNFSKLKTIIEFGMAPNGIGVQIRF